MKVDDRIIDIIEDHESIVQTLDGIVCAIENKTEFPNYIPVLHDGLVTDLLTKIIVRLKGGDGKWVSTLSE